jgi:molybdenum cofactor cytidylyltransferase
MIAAVILAAGESRRMGQPKMLLPWGNGTILGQVISTYQEAGLEDILVVTGGESERIGDIAKQHRARTVFNEQFSSGEMLSSLQCGLWSLSTDEAEVEAALIGLGDQPQVQAGSVRQICETFRTQPARLIVPSFKMRRGHPWLVERSLWSELLALMPPQSPRDFLNLHAAEILYVEMDTASILADLDTPQDYQNARPKP